MTANLIKIQYIGSKPVAYDNVAKSGVSWTGHGDIQSVTDIQAKILLKFPDQWALVDKKDAAVVNTPISLKVIDEDGDEVLVDPTVLNKPLDRMTKSELLGYAKNKWGKVLDARSSSKSMIDKIEEWETELDVTVGIPE